MGREAKRKKLDDSKRQIFIITVYMKRDRFLPVLVKNLVFENVV